MGTRLMIQIDVSILNGNKFGADLSKSWAPNQWSAIALCGPQAIANHWSGAQDLLRLAPDPGSF